MTAITVTWYGDGNRISGEQTFHGVKSWRRNPDTRELTIVFDDGSETWVPNPASVRLQTVERLLEINDDLATRLANTQVRLAEARAAERPKSESLTYTASSTETPRRRRWWSR